MRALVDAGNRFHDDFEIAQTVRPDGFTREDWLRCASGAVLSGGSEKQQLLIERVAATLARPRARIVRYFATLLLLSGWS